MSFLYHFTGSYWIYHIHTSYQHVDAALPDYCDQTLYLFAFWVQTVCYIFLALSVLLCCAGCVCVCCLGLFKGGQQVQDQP